MDRLNVSFESGALRCRAWFYPVATNTEQPSACVVLGHGFGCVRRLGLDAFCRNFQAGGVAALAFDYRHFGESEGEPRQLIDIGCQLEDWRAAIAFARSLATLDGDRIALWGTSLGGAHAIVTAAADPRVAAVVAQVPYIGGLKFALRTGLVHSLRLALAGLRDELYARRGREPYYIPLYGPPGTLAGIAAAGVLDRVTMLTEGSVDNRYTPRVGLRLGGYRPMAKLDRVDCPVLICAAEHEAARWGAVAATSRVTVRRYEVGPFEIYDGPVQERVADEQRNFLTAQLLERKDPTPDSS
jgi:uncharacterized protein